MTKYLLIAALFIFAACSEKSDKKSENETKDTPKEESLPESCQKENVVSLAVEFNDSVSYKTEKFEIVSSHAEDKRGVLSISLLNFESDIHSMLDLEGEQAQVKIYLYPVERGEASLTTGNFMPSGHADMKDFYCIFHVSYGTHEMIYHEIVEEETPQGYFNISHLTDNKICCDFDLTDASGQNCKGSLTLDLDRW